MAKPFRDLNNAAYSASGYWPFLYIKIYLVNPQHTLWDALDRIVFLPIIHHLNFYVKARNDHGYSLLLGLRLYRGLGAIHISSPSRTISRQTHDRFASRTVNVSAPFPLLSKDMQELERLHISETKGLREKRWNPNSSAH